jgi:hypothetical protein
MEPSESKSNTKEVVEGKPVKEIAESAVSLETTALVKSAVDHLETHGLEAAPVTDPEGTLVGKISKDRMIRGVSGRGHDPQTTPLELEVEKEGEPYCRTSRPLRNFLGGVALGIRGESYSRYGRTSNHLRKRPLKRRTR